MLKNLERMPEAFQDKMIYTEKQSNKSIVVTY